MSSSWNGGGGQGPPSKFVIRKLPPLLPEEDFYNQLHGLCKDELEWFRFHPGGFESRGIRTSSAFIKLKHPELAPFLKHVLQNSPFVGEHGVQYQCEMEAALFQKVPKGREKQDPYIGTYEEDPFYQQFMKEIEEEDEAAARGPTVTAHSTIESEPKQEAIVTPLMQHIIDAHTPKSQGSRQRSGKGRKDGREKENQKRQQLPTIEEGGKQSRSQPSGKGHAESGPCKTVNAQSKREPSSKSKGDTQAAKNRTSIVKGRGETVNVEVVGKETIEASRIAAQAAARAAAQLAHIGIAGDNAGVERAERIPKNGKSAADTGKDTLSIGVSQENVKVIVPAKGSENGHEVPKKSKSKGGKRSQAGRASSSKRTSSSSTNAVDTTAKVTASADRVAEVAAAAAAAALSQSGIAEKSLANIPPARMRPALAARGVADALSRAGMKKPSLGVRGKKEELGAGS